MRLLLSVGSRSIGTMTEKRTAAATRLGFPRCPICRKFCKLIGYAVSGFEELEIRACLTCVNQMEAMDKLTDEISEISKICEIAENASNTKVCLTEGNVLAHDVQIW